MDSAKLFNILIDENISIRIKKLLLNAVDAATHVSEVGLCSVTDRAIWEYAKNNHLIILTKDSDFRQYAFLYGAPPKIICLGVGNSSTDKLGELFLNKIDEIKNFLTDEEASLIIL